MTNAKRRNERSKLEYLRSMGEKELTDILFELFSKKYEDVKITHGPSEFGVDILFCKFDDFLKEKEYYGVQVKGKDIGASLFNTIINQIEMACSHTFFSTKSSYKLDHYWVITSGKFTINAEQIIFERLSNKHLTKIIRFFDGKKVCELIDDHAPEIFYTEHEKYFSYFTEIDSRLDNINDLKTIGSTKEKKVSELYVSLKVCEDLDEDENLFDDFESKQKFVIQSEKLLEAETRAVVLGGPGAGKTTLLRHIALDIASKNLKKDEYRFFPVYVKLNEFIRFLHKEFEHEISTYERKLQEFEKECQKKFAKECKFEIERLVDHKESLLGRLEKLKTRRSSLTKEASEINRAQNTLKGKKKKLSMDKERYENLPAEIKKKRKSIENNTKKYDRLKNEKRLEDKPDKLERLEKLGKQITKDTKSIKSLLKEKDTLQLFIEKKYEVALSEFEKRIDDNAKRLENINDEKDKILAKRKLYPQQISEVKNALKSIATFKTRFLKAIENLKKIKEDLILYGQTQIPFKKIENLLLAIIEKVSSSFEIIFRSHDCKLIEIFQGMAVHFGSKIGSLIAEEKKDFVSPALIKNLKNTGFKNVKDLLTAELYQNKVLLLLDGFDELSNINNKRMIVHNLKIFIKKFPMNRYIVTSRGAGYNEEFKSLAFRKFEIIEFNESQILQFLTNWFSNEVEKTHNLFNDIKKNPAVFFLARIPIMLAIIAVLFEEKKKQLPNRRVDLFKEISDLLLGRWDSERMIPNKYETSDKHFLLRKIAFRNHMDGKTFCPDKDIIDYIKNYSLRLSFSDKACRGVFKEIWARSGLIQEVTIKEFGFLHLSFQEYFSAMELLTQVQTCYDFVKNHFFDEWWKEVFILMAGILGEADNFIEFVENEISVPETGRKKDIKKAEAYKLEMLICMISEATLTDYSLRKRLFESIILNRIKQELSPRLLSILGTDYQKVMFIDSRFLITLCEDYASDPVLSERILMVTIALQKVDVLEKIINTDWKIYKSKLKAWSSTKSLNSCLTENQVDSLKRMLHSKAKAK